MNEIEPTDRATSAFLEMIESHKGIVFKVANSYCRDAEDRKDLIQEIIVQLWRSRDRYDESFAQSTWIYRIALNVSISAYRKSSRRDSISTPLTDAIVLVADNTPLESESEEIQLLKLFISELKELDRALILLYLDQKSQKEMAEILGLSPTNIGTKLNRIKHELREKFNQIGEAK